MQRWAAAALRQAIIMMDIKFRSFGLGLAVGAGLGAGGTYFYVNRVQAPQVMQQAPGVDGAKDAASGFRFHPALKFGMPQTEFVRFFTGFVSSFDPRTRNPKWVLEYLDEAGAWGEGTRQQSVFFEDTGIEPRFRSKLEDFWQSGYDRGHLAPAANHKGSQKAMDDTFTLSNISPQVGAGFNRDYWARFEKLVKDVVKHADGVYVVTGPLYLPQPDGESNKWMMKHPMIGKPPTLVSVPTHFYKVVLAENKSGKHGRHSAAVGAFVLPNAPIDPATPVSAFTVPLESLEAVAGTKFFPGYVSDQRRSALDEAALQWQDMGRRQMKMLDRSSLAVDQAVMLPERVSVEVIASNPGRGRLPGFSQDTSLPKTQGGDGAIHLCEHVACKLPPEKWYENNKSGGSGGKGGGRQIKRQ